MRRKGGYRRRMARTRFEARCAWCGTVSLEAHQIDVFVGPRQEALVEFGCPVCQRLNVIALEIGDVATLRLVGIEPSPGPAPFELLEEHRGPAIGWDDLIDLHDALRDSGGPGEPVPEAA
jgi:hypothetical protein